VAASLRQEPGLEVESVDGNRGEFSVLVDGQEVIRKGENMPSVEQVRDAVRKAGTATPA
jgi:hypothetical protein